MTTHPALLEQSARYRQAELRSVGDLRRRRVRRARPRFTTGVSAAGVPSLRHILAAFRPHPRPATHR